MSRITLSRYDDGSTHVVVGWDHPARGAFWQEYASKQEIADAEKLEQRITVTEASMPLEYETLLETEVKCEGGMWPGIPTEQTCRIDARRVKVTND